MKIKSQLGSSMRKILRIPTMLNSSTFNLLKMIVMAREHSYQTFSRKLITLLWIHKMHPHRINSIVLQVMVQLKETIKILALKENTNRFITTITTMAMEVFIINNLIKLLLHLYNSHLLILMQLKNFKNW